MSYWRNRTPRHRLESRLALVRMAVVCLALMPVMASEPAGALAAERSRSRTDVRGNTVNPSALRTSRSGRALRDVERLMRTGTPTNAAWVRLESGPVAFGEILPGVFNELRDGLRIRVFAAGDWSLRVRPAPELQNHDRGGESVPVSRLSWRTASGGGWANFSTTSSVVIARGGPTGAGGELVTVDLGLALDGDDELGNYGCLFQIVLESS